MNQKYAGIDFVNDHASSDKILSEITERISSTDDRAEQEAILSELTKDGLAVLGIRESIRFPYAQSRMKKIDMVKVLVHVIRDRNAQIDSGMEIVTQNGMSPLLEARYLKCGKGEYVEWAIKQYQAKYGIRYEPTMTSIKSEAPASEPATPAEPETEASKTKEINSSTMELSETSPTEVEQSDDTALVRKYFDAEEYDAFSQLSREDAYALVGEYRQGLEGCKSEAEVIELLGKLDKVSLFWVLTTIGNPYILKGHLGSVQEMVSVFAGYYWAAYGKLNVARAALPAKSLSNTEVGTEATAENSEEASLVFEAEVVEADSSDIVEHEVIEAESWEELRPRSMMLSDLEKLARMMTAEQQKMRSIGRKVMGRVISRRKGGYVKLRKDVYSPRQLTIKFE